MRGRRVLAAAALVAALAWSVGGTAWADPDPPPAGGTPPPADPPKDPPADPPKDPPAEPPPADPPPDDPEAAAKEAAEKAAKAEENRIKDLVAAFTRMMRKGTPDEQKKALTDISSIKHKLVAEALTPWIEPTVEEGVRSLAIEVAKSQKSPVLAQHAAVLLDKNQTDIKYARAMISIMGAAKDKKQIDKLRNMIKAKDTNLELQKEAVVALGLIGDRGPVPDFIHMVKEFENKNLPKKDIPRRDALQKLVEDNLDLITGQHFPNARGWELWWKDNEKTFQKTPPPDSGGGDAPK